VLPLSKTNNEIIVAMKIPEIYNYREHADHFRYKVIPVFALENQIVKMIDDFSLTL